MSEDSIWKRDEEAIQQFGILHDQIKFILNNLNFYRRIAIKNSTTNTITSEITAEGIDDLTIIEGSGISINKTDINELTISSSGAGTSGVTSIVAGTNITISSTGQNGTGEVTINSTAGGGGGGTNPAAPSRSVQYHDPASGAFGGEEDFLLHTSAAGNSQIGIHIDPGIASVPSVINSPFMIGAIDSNTSNIRSTPSIIADTYNWSSTNPGGLILPEPKYHHDIQVSGIVAPGTRSLQGVGMYTNNLTNQSRGILPLWGLFGGSPTDLQVPVNLGHTPKIYHAINPLADSIQAQKVSFDLGSSSRIEPAKGSYNYGLYPWIDQFENPGSDDPFVPDQDANIGDQGEWKGQIVYKGIVPGQYIFEQRWDRIIGKSNYTGQVSVRCTDAPTTTFSGMQVTGVDFYDQELGLFTQRTSFNTGTYSWRAGSSLLIRSLDILKQRDIALTDTLFEVTSDPNTIESVNNNASAGVYEPNLTGDHAAYMYFKESGTGTPTIFINGLTGTIKARKLLQIGDELNTNKNIMTTQGCLFRRYDASSNTYPETYSCALNQENNHTLRLRTKDGTESVIISSIDPVSGSASVDHTALDIKRGLVYIKNSFNVTNGINNDRVGIMELGHEHTNNVFGFDYFRITSEYNIRANYSNYNSTDSIPNIIHCVNNSHAAHDYSILEVDLAGKTTYRSDELVDQFTIRNTYTQRGSSPSTFNYNGSMFNLVSNGQRSVQYSHDYSPGDTINANGFIFARFSHTREAGTTTVSITGGGGGGAIAGAIISDEGTVDAITFFGGTGYTSPPTVTINGGDGNSTALATIDANGNLDSITITNPGSGHDPRVEEMAFQVDGDGSVKCKESVTILATNSGTATWPPTGNQTHNLTLSARDIHQSVGGDNTGCHITTSYSNHEDGTPLYLQAAGQNGPDLTTGKYTNMVNIIENVENLQTDGNGDKYNEVHLCLRNPSTSSTSGVDYFRNYFWLNNKTSLNDNDGYYISSYKNAGGSNRNKFEIRKTGKMDENGINSTLAVDSYILRYDPDKIAPQQASMNVDDAYLIIGDDRRQIVRIGAGSERYATGETFNLNINANPRVLGSILDVQTIFGDNILCRHLAAGNGNSTLSLGKESHGNTLNVEIDMSHTGAQSFAFLGNNGYISCTTVQNYQTGSSGPTNICNANHNGYIGTFNVASTTGTGLRGNTVNANLVSGVAFAATAKLYKAPLNTAGPLARVPGYDDDFTWNYTPSTLESPQGLIVLRGQIEMTTINAIIDLDTCAPDQGCNMIVPHTFPDVRNQGLFHTMFKNPTIFVTNAGIRNSATAVDTYGHQTDLNFTPVAASIKFNSPQIPIQPNQNYTTTKLLVELPQGAQVPLCVNYVIYAERADKGYSIFGRQAAPQTGHLFVQQYYNQYLGGQTTTFNAVSNNEQWTSSFGVSIEDLEDGQ